MKINMKKIIVSLFMLAFLSMGTSAFATSIWNTGSQGPECPDINIANATTTTGYGSPCWTLTNVSASSGNIVAVKIYYHNTSNGTATNTHIRVIAPSGSSTTQSFTGQILSPQGNLYTSAVTASLSSAQTVTFQSTVWYTQDQYGNLQPTSLLNGQSGSEAIGPNGLYIGNIPPGWPAQGAVVVNFLVSNTPPPQNCSISSFTANPNQINSGASSTLAWNTSNCTSASISPNVGNVNVNGNKTVYPTQTTTYTLTAYGSSGGQQTQSVTVAVNQPQNCSINSFTANPNPINPDASSNLSWSTSNCISASISPGIGNVPLSGSHVISPASTTTYVLTATGSNGQTQTQSVTVTVNQPQTCSISYFTASPTSITSGSSSTLAWNTTNCTSVNISNLNYNVPVSGSQVVYPTYTTTYVLTAYGASGAQQTQTQTVTVNNNQNSNCYISNFTVNNQNSVTLQSGASATIAWNVSNSGSSNNTCTVTVSGPNFSGSGLYGSQTIYPTYSGTYTLTVYGSSSGTQTQSVYVNVNNNQNNNCVISYFSASPTSVNYGGASTLSWSATNCSSISITNLGSVNTYGSQIVYPTYTTTYTLTAYGSSNYGYNGGSQTQSVTVNVNNYTPPPAPIYNTCAVTTVATNVTQNGATLNGLISNSNGGSASAYFEYGTTVNMGQQTNSQAVNGNTTFSQIVSGLSPNTIYFYRFDANCGGGISQGSVNFFQTSGTNTNTVVTRTIIRQGTTVIGTESPIMLKIEDRYQTIRVGDGIDYTVTYKNISNRTLTHPILQVILPKGITFLNSSRGTYSSDTYTLTISLEDLVPNVEGTVYLQGRVDSIDTGNAQIVTTALLVYTARNGAQENAMAYVLNNPEGGNNNLTALAIFGSMFGMGILGWLLLLILILLAILLYRKLYRKPYSTTTTTHTDTHEQF